MFIRCSFLESLRLAAVKERIKLKMEDNLPDTGDLRFDAKCTCCPPPPPPSPSPSSLLLLPPSPPSASGSGLAPNSKSPLVWGKLKRIGVEGLASGLMTPRSFWKPLSD